MWSGLLALIFCCGLVSARAEAANAPKILALGDSLTAGFGLPPGEAFPDKLQAALRQAGIEATVINAGVSGDTAAGGLARLGWVLADHPDYALVELGANDALRGIDPKETYRDLDGILDQLQAAGVKPLLLGMKAPANWGADYDHAFDAIYPTLAAKHHIALYPFYLEGVVLDPRFNQPDMMHPNEAGVAIIVGKILPYVERLVSGK